MGAITRTFANQIKTGGKLDADGLDLTDTFAFTGTVTGAGGVNTPAFLAKMSADQTVTSATTNKVTFNSEVFDTDSCYDPTTNYRFTPNVAGKYFLYAQLDNEGSDITANWTYFYKNGSVIWGSRHDATGHTYTTQSMSVVVEANGSTDYFEVYQYLDTTGTPKIKADFGGADVSFFGGYKIIE